MTFKSKSSNQLGAKRSRFICAGLLALGLIIAATPNTVASQTADSAQTEVQSVLSKSKVQQLPADAVAPPPADVYGTIPILRETIPSSTDEIARPTGVAPGSAATSAPTFVLPATSATPLTDVQVTGAALPLRMTVLSENGIAAPFAVQSLAALPHLNQLFLDDPKWRGADGACSIRIDENVAVWLFGDTFIKNDPTAKSSYSFINNTAANYDLQAPCVHFSYATDHGAPCAILKTGIPGAWYWPGDGFLVDKALYVVCKKVLFRKSEDPIFSFVWQSDDCAVITNPKAGAERWDVSYFNLPDDKDRILVGTASYFDGEYAYFFTSLPAHVSGANVHPAGISRLSREQLLRKDASHIEYWNGSSWGADANQSQVLFADGAPEMTVTRLPGEPYLVATYMPPLSSRICLRFAAKPEGPWSSPIEVYQCPESAISVLGDKTAVYSAKAHPELTNQNDELVITYCSNPGEMKHYLSRPDLYFPRFISIKLRKNN